MLDPRAWLIRIGIGALALAAAGAIGYVNGRIDGSAKVQKVLNAERIKASRLVAEATGRVAAVENLWAERLADSEKRNEIARVELATRYASAVDDVARLRVRLNTVRSDTVPGSAPAAGGSEAVVCEGSLSREASRRVVALMREADEQARVLQQCKDYADTVSAQP